MNSQTSTANVEYIARNLRAASEIVDAAKRADVDVEYVLANGATAIVRLASVNDADVLRRTLRHRQWREAKPPYTVDVTGPHIPEQHGSRIVSAPWAGMALLTW